MEPVIEHERAPLDLPVATDNIVDQADTSQLSEYEKHKVARGYGKPPAIPPAEAKTPTPAATPEPVTGEEPGAEGETAETAPLDEKHKFVDPDTGEALDGRRRATKRVKALLSERARLRDRIATLEAHNSRPAGEVRPEPRPQTPPATSTATDDPEPQLANFQSYDDYTKATARWVARQELTSARDSERASGEQARQREQFSQFAEQYAQKLPAIRQQMPDYDEVAARIPMIPETRHITRAVLESNVGPQLVYFLGTHPEALEAIMAAPTFEAHLRLIGRYEAQVEATTTAQPATPRTTRAPEPVTPVSHAGATTIGKPDPTSSLAEWRKARGYHPTTNR
jgi:hypothetical protein